MVGRRGREGVMDEDETELPKLELRKWASAWCGGLRQQQLVCLPSLFVSVLRLATGTLPLSPLACLVSNCRLLSLSALCPMLRTTPQIFAGACPSMTATLAR